MQHVNSIFGRALLAMAFAGLAGSALAADGAAPVLGRWDLTLGDGPTPSWVEFAEKDGKIAARFLYMWASVYDLKEYKVEADKVEFKAENQTWTATVQGDTMTGTRVNDKGEKSKFTGKRFIPQLDLNGAWTFDGKDKVVLTLKHQGDKITGELKEGNEKPEVIENAKLDHYTLSFAVEGEKYTARVKGDLLDGVMAEEGGKKYEFTARRQRQWGQPVELFNGKNLDGWKPLGDPNTFKWKVADGLLQCEGHSANIVSDKKFKDFKIHVEFRLPEGGNSGIYLRGRHEIQVAADKPGGEPSDHGLGSLYSRIRPLVNASKGPGEWQTFDITLIDHYVTVVLNGKMLIDNQEVEGITGGAMDSDENAPGPIYLQGDHTAVEYRKITVTPAK